MLFTIYLVYFFRIETKFFYIVFKETLLQIWKSKYIFVFTEK